MDVLKPFGKKQPFSLDAGCFPLNDQISPEMMRVLAQLVGTGGGGIGANAGTPLGDSAGG